MRSLNVVERDPVADGTACVLQALESVSVKALFFQGSDETRSTMPFCSGVSGW
tara:strand:- start:413 stop:571 length:159 start_codon:yes stop_codon:yes gene_type:complete